MRKAIAITLTPGERGKLETIVGSAVAAVRDVQRGRIILLAAVGQENQEIAPQVGLSVKTVSLWRRRFAQQRLEGLRDQTGRGRKRTHGPGKVEEIITLTLTTTPTNASHWSTRSMAKQAGVGPATVHRIWSAHQLKPHLVKTFKLSTDKRFTEKLRDVVGLYLNPPEHALVLSVDEKTSIQALDRTQPGLPLKKGRCATMTHDYKRHGATTLFAALNVVEGTMIGTCMPRHRHQEFLKFLRLIDQQTPKDMELHLTADNYATHKHPKVQGWLAKHPRFHMHFIPTSSSWLNAIEGFFAKLTEQPLRRGIFRSVLELIQAIDAYLEHTKENPKPFIWKKSADEILTKLAPLYAAHNNSK